MLAELREDAPSKIELDLFPGSRPSIEDHRTPVPYTPSSFWVPVQGLTWDGTPECLTAVLDWLRVRLTPARVGGTIGAVRGDATALHLSVIHASAPGRVAHHEHEVVPTGWVILVHLRTLHVVPPAA